MKEIVPRKHSLHEKTAAPVQNQSLPSFKLTTTLTHSLTPKQASWNHSTHSSQPYQVIPFLSSSFVPLTLHTSHSYIAARIDATSTVDHGRLLHSPLFFLPTILLLLLFFLSLPLFDTCCLLFLSKLSYFFLLLCLTLFPFFRLHTTLGHRIPFLLFQSFLLLFDKIVRNNCCVEIKCLTIFCTY